MQVTSLGFSRSVRFGNEETHTGHWLYYIYFRVLLFLLKDYYDFKMTYVGFLSELVRKIYLVS